MQTPANPPKIAAFKFSSIFLRRIVGAMFTRVNSKCAHQVRPPPSPISGNDAQLAIEAFDDGKPPRTPPREPSSNPGMVRDLFDDMRFGLRLIRKHPGLSAATVLTFTLGLGLDAGVFTVIDGLMFRPRVGYNPGSFVEITEDVADATGRIAAAPLISLRDYSAFARAASLRDVAAWTPVHASVGGALTRPEQVPLLVTCNFFTTYGPERPLLGRTFHGEDCAPSATSSVVVIGEDLWRATLNADPDVIGKTMLLNGRPFTIVGVMSSTS